MNIDFQHVLQALKQDIAAIAEKELKNYAVAATKDGMAILKSLQDDLENWTRELASGELTKADFTDLVMGQKDELELIALKQAGLTKIAADQFKQNTFNLIVSRITGLIP